MPKAKIIYQSNEEILGRHIPSKEWVTFTGKLTLYDRKTYPVVLKLKSEIADSFIGMYVNEKKDFKGDSVSAVFGKMAKWLFQHDILFQN